MRFAEIDKPFLLQDAYCAFCTCQAAARSLSGHDPGNSMFTSWVEEVLKPQTFIFWIFCPKARLLYSFVPGYQFFESCRAELKLLFNRDIKSEEKAGWRVKCCYIHMERYQKWFLLLEYLALMPLWQELFDVFWSLADLRPTWRVDKAQMMRRRVRMWKSNKDALFASPADLCRPPDSKGAFLEPTCKQWKKQILCIKISR